MTKTLTTKVLNDFIAGQGYGVAPSAVEAMARELLANREAQPVAEVVSKYGDPEAFGEREIRVLADLQQIPYDTKLFTAPPAPAAVNGRTAEGWMAEALLQKKIADDLRNSAPAVPESMPEVDRGEGGSDIDYMQPQEIYGMGKADGWNACRAAMLAQPVSQGYKRVPVEPTEEMIAAAMNCDDVEFNSDETFCVNFDNIYRAMLAAAPEGGN